ncbi:DUF11 domain-containing protein [Nonomuraea sp. NBC_00507]|uniref:DUF11 domain-containing protein n=1 Tax=Nonomuraea sp. NBC_00507 TaxID=2976002 RepID=UPI002E1878BF
MPGIAAIVALAALGGGGWSGQSPAAVSLPGAGPELRITTTVTPDPMTTGGVSVYAVTVTNTGGDDAEDVTIIDTLDRGTSPGRLPDGCSLAGQAITCGGPGLTIPPGQSVTYDIPVTTDPSLPDDTDVVARVHVTASNATGDTTRLISRTRTMADVEIATTGPSSVKAGAGITYRVKVGNNGPSPAVGVTVEDPIDGDLTMPTGRPSECPAGNCRLGTLAPRESRTLVFTAAAPDVTGVIDNCAAVSTASHEQNTGNNRSCTSIAVEAVHSPSPSPARTLTRAPPERRAPAVADRAEPRPGGDGPRKEPRATVTGSRPGVDPYEPSPVPSGQPAARDHEPLPMTGVSLWLIGLGVPVLLAIGLLVRCLSSRE